MAQQIFRKGLDLKDAVAGALAADYHSDLVERIRTSAGVLTSGRLTLHLAREFGFCYGVDRAVDYAYQARRRFGDRHVFLTGEIIHNPHVNAKLRGAGIRFLSDPDEADTRLGPDDVVIIPAFGVTVRDLERYQSLGCTLVDTTCGSVLNVWKNVTRYARDGFTAIIHGKVHHEETQATASQALRHPAGRYLVVLDHAQAERVCDHITSGGDPAAFLTEFEDAVSPGFDSERDLVRVGLANQTTMLMSESLAIADLFKVAMTRRYGEANLAEHYRAFDTICSATQERQDAVLDLLRTTPLDLMIVIGGYNSSNTCNLARICAESVPTYHIADQHGLTSASEIRHRPIAPAGRRTAEVSTRTWLPGTGRVRIGLTAGASTPNNITGAAITRIASLAGEPITNLAGAAAGARLDAPR